MASQPDRTPFPKLAQLTKRLPPVEQLPLGLMEPILRLRAALGAPAMPRLRPLNPSQPLVLEDLTLVEGATETVLGLDLHLHAINETVQVLRAAVHLCLKDIVISGDQTSFHDLDPNVRLLNCLRAMRCITIGDIKKRLSQETEGDLKLMSFAECKAQPFVVPGFGKQSYSVLIEVLEEEGFINDDGVWIR